MVFCGVEFFGGVVKQKFFMFLSVFIMALMLVNTAFAEYYDEEPEPQKRGRNELSLVFDGGANYGGGTDKFGLFFAISTTDIKTSGMIGRFGFEGVTRAGFSARLLVGYEHIFYSSIGIGQIIHSYFTTDILFSYYPKKEVRRWDPYVTAGPKIRVGKSGAQGYVNVGGGVRYFFNDRWSLRLEPVAFTDFDGVWGEMHVGAGFHF